MFFCLLRYFLKVYLHHFSFFKDKMLVEEEGHGFTSQWYLFNNNIFIM
jgi:hypothetical protein